MLTALIDDDRVVPRAPPIAQDVRASAKTHADRDRDIAPTNVATMNGGMSDGLILGTAAYMAPEQARGQAVDRRADIWTFGGETVADVLASVLKNEPDWGVLPRTAPRSIVGLIRRCLTTDRKNRLRDIGEARIAISEYLADPAAASIPGGEFGAPVPASRWGVALTAVLAAALLVALGLLWRGAKRVEQPVLRYEVQLPQNAKLNLGVDPVVAVSPDGSVLVFSATVDDARRLYIRKRDDLDARALNGTEGASAPVISPDSKWVAFFADNKLKRAPLGDGPVVALADVSDPRGASWDGNDAIIYAPQGLSGLLRVSATGGTPTEVTTLDKTKNERTHRWPDALPGGKAVLFTVGVVSSPDNYDGATIDALMPATRERREVLRGASMARFVSSGYLIFGRNRVLYAVKFDPDRLTISGTPVPVVQGVEADVTTGALHYSCSATGTLAYVPASPGGDLRRLVWVDRTGKIEALPLAAGVYYDPRISPDGRRAAITVANEGGTEVWIYDFGNGTFTRLTFGGANSSPIWSRDGRTLFYMAFDASGRASVMKKPADGSREADVVTTLDRHAFLEQTFADEQSLLLAMHTESRMADIVSLKPKGGAMPSPLVATRFDEYGPALSPNGRWLAYHSSETGRFEIYVSDVSGTGGRWQVSSAGGEEPRWSPDGRELYYRNDNLFMMAPVQTDGAFHAGTPTKLFDGVYNLRSENGVSYSVDPRGNRFLMLRLADEGASTRELRVVVNWFSELGHRLGSSN